MTRLGGEQKDTSLHSTSSSSSSTPSATPSAACLASFLMRQSSSSPSDSSQSSSSGGGPLLAVSHSSKRSTASIATATFLPASLLGAAFCVTHSSIVQGTVSAVRLVVAAKVRLPLNLCHRRMKSGAPYLTARCINPSPAKSTQSSGLAPALSSMAAHTRDSGLSRTRHSCMGDFPVQSVVLMLEPLFRHTRIALGLQLRAANASAVRPEGHATSRAFLSCFASSLQM
mmetsp:Transcript_7054/g.12021  ORF Transcript_7054/g.12021 Transcript_7054/m.12021 type:complete len:228 (-) Transcript_7054:560-1243(-)